MKILVVQETDWVERGPHQQHHLFERLDERGHDVRVVDFEFLWHEQDNHDLFREREVYDAPTQVVDTANPTLIRPPMVKVPLLDKATIPITHGRELLRQFREFDPDVVVAFGILNAAVASRLSSWYDVPFIHYLIDHLHTLVPNEHLQSVSKAVESYTIRSADYVYTINQGLADYAVQMGADPNDVRILPGGVDLERYRSGSREEVSLPVNLGPDDNVLFFMGWLYEFSGLDEITEKMQESDRYDDYTLLVVGDGDLYDELEARKSELGDNLVLTGKVPFEDIPHYLDYADICLLPARHNDVMHDIVPIKMYEYLAADCPTVATDLPGIHKEFGEGNGVVYTEGPRDALDTAISLFESDEYEEAQKRARSFINEYDWPLLADDFEEDMCDISSGREPSTARRLE